MAFSPLFIDPIMNRLLKIMQPGDILDEALAYTKVKTQNYTMPARSCAVLRDVPHWFPQFRATIKDNRLKIDNLYALPVGHKTISYRIKDEKIIVRVGIEDVPATFIHQTVGKDLLDIIQYDGFPHGLIISKARFEPVDHGKNSLKAMRITKQANLTNQIVFEIDKFEWVRYQAPVDHTAKLLKWDNRSFYATGNGKFDSIRKLIKPTHPKSVDAQLCHQLAPGHPAIARLWIENAFDAGGKTFSPHLCIKRNYHRYIKHEAFRNLKGSWVRRRSGAAPRTSIEWMIPIHLNSQEQILKAIGEYYLVVVLEHGKISAYRSKKGFGQTQREMIGYDEEFIRMTMDMQEGAEDSNRLKFE